MFVREMKQTEIQASECWVGNKEDNKGFKKKDRRYSKRERRNMARKNEDFHA